MHRFIVDDQLCVGALVRLSDKEAHHALRVLRLETGAEVQITNGAGELYDGTLSVQSDGVYVVAERLARATEPPVVLTLYQGLPKFEKLELICQKLTELGAVRIVPVKTMRSVVKLDDKDGEKKRERMARICAEAAKQCGRSVVPEVLQPMSFKQALTLMAEEELMLMPWEREDIVSLKQVHEEWPDARRIGLFIGPEGGIDDDEAREACQKLAKRITLGPRILRTETAAIASAAIVMQLWGDI